MPLRCISVLHFDKVDEKRRNTSDYVVLYNCERELASTEYSATIIFRAFYWIEI